MLFKLNQLLNKLRKTNYKSVPYQIPDDQWLMPWPHKTLSMQNFFGHCNDRDMKYQDGD